MSDARLLATLHDLRIRRWDRVSVGDIEHLEAALASARERVLQLSAAWLECEGISARGLLEPSSIEEG